ETEKTCHALLQSPVGIPVCHLCAKARPVGLLQEPCRQRPILLAPALSQTFDDVLDSLINADNHRRIPNNVLAHLCLSKLHYQLQECHQVRSLKCQHEILIVKTKGVCSIKPHLRELSTDHDVLFHHFLALLKWQQVPLA